MATVVPETRDAFFRLATLKGALKLELVGMHRSSGPSAYKILKGMGYEGSKEGVLAQVEEDVEEAIECKQDRANAEEVVDLSVRRELQRARQVFGKGGAGDDAA